MPLSLDLSYWKLKERVRDGPPPTLPEDDLRWSPDFKDFIRQMLVKNAVDRPAAEELLLHPFLRVAREQYEREGGPGVQNPCPVVPRDLKVKQAALAHLDEITMAIREHCFEVKSKPGAPGPHPKRRNFSVDSVDLSHSNRIHQPGQLLDFARQLGLSKEDVQSKLQADGIPGLVAQIRPLCESDWCSNSTCSSDSNVEILSLPSVWHPVHDGGSACQVTKFAAVPCPRRRSNDARRTGDVSSIRLRSLFQGQTVYEPDGEPVNVFICHVPQARSHARASGDEVVKQKSIRLEASLVPNSSAGTPDQQGACAAPELGEETSLGKRLSGTVTAVQEQVTLVEDGEQSLGLC
eukprot:scaffold48_cov311-Pinguiococcus_pyrenoidosus.AAC.323